MPAPKTGGASAFGRPGLVPALLPVPTPRAESSGSAYSFPAGLRGSYVTPGCAATAEPGAMRADSTNIAGIPRTSAMLEGGWNIRAGALLLGGVLIGANSLFGSFY